MKIAFSIALPPFSAVTEMSPKLPRDWNSPPLIPAALKALTVNGPKSPEAVILPSRMPMPLIDRTSTPTESIPPENARISPPTIPLPSSPPCTVALIGPIEPA